MDLSLFVFPLPSASSFHTSLFFNNSSNNHSHLSPPSPAARSAYQSPSRSRPPQLVAFFGSWQRTKQEQSEKDGKRRAIIDNGVMRSLMTEFLTDVIAQDERRAAVAGGRRKDRGNRWWNWLLFWNRGNNAEKDEENDRRRGEEVDSNEQNGGIGMDLEESPLLKSLYFLGTGLSSNEGIREKMPYLMSEKSERSRNLILVLRQVLEADRKRRKRQRKSAEKNKAQKKTLEDQVEASPLGSMTALYKAAEKVVSCGAIATLLMNPLSINI